MIFRKLDSLRRKLKFTFQEEEIEIVRKLFFSGITFTTGGSFAETHKILGQALKAIFKLNQYLYTFTDLSPKHIPELLNWLGLYYVMGEKSGVCQSLFNRRECIFSSVKSYLVGKSLPN